jgi:acetyl-CoA C-acetyltransferase
VLGRVLGYADAELRPEDFTIAPAAAVPRALAAARVTQAEVEYWEINEAFSVVDLINQRLLGLDPERWGLLT